MGQRQVRGVDNNERHSSDVGGKALMRWENEVKKIMTKTGKYTAVEITKMLRDAGQKSPCKHLHINFEKLPELKTQCALSLDMSCLTCGQYEPYEKPGELGPGYACYDTAPKMHLVEFVQTDGFNRSGQALCGRWPDEELEAVEIYPAEWKKVVKEFGSGSICENCLEWYNEETEDKSSENGQ
jgi:hypothetical protein